MKKDLPVLKKIAAEFSIVVLLLININLNAGIIIRFQTVPPGYSKIYHDFILYTSLILKPVKGDQNHRRLYAIKLCSVLAMTVLFCK
jgi:hypothetical protein